MKRSVIFNNYEKKTRQLAGTVEEDTLISTQETFIHLAILPKMKKKLKKLQEMQETVCYVCFLC